MNALFRKYATVTCIAIGVLLSPFIAAAQSELKTIRSGFWKGAVKTDAQGNASYCYLLAQKSNEFNIQIYWSREGFHVAIYSSDWALVTGEEFKGRVRIDKRFDEMVEASIVASDAITYLFGFNNNAIDAFQSGNRITMEGPAGERTFRLTGTRKAIDVLVDCADEFLATESDPESDLTPDLDVGKSAYQNGNYLVALENWRPLAEAGHAIAQNGMGVLYYTGRAVPKNHSIAADWFHRSAEQGYDKAQNNLGVMYRDGKGVTKDFSEAIHWFRLAAEQGYAAAQSSLGTIYFNGQGIEVDYAEASYWFRAAAEQGEKIAQNNLGEMYRDGQGVTQNNSKAMRWFLQSAEQGYKPGQQNLDAMLALNTGPEQNEPDPAPDVTAAMLIDRATFVLEGDPTPEQGASARTDVEAALEMGDRRALLLMSLVLGNGIGGPVDLEKARDYLNQAADALVPEALYQRALLTAETDPDKALLDIRLAAAEGYVPALQVYATLDHWENFSSDTDAPAEPIMIAKGELIGIQAMLNSLGYPAGPPTGEMTEETTAAIKAFQEKIDQPVDGVPTRELQAQLIKALGEGN